MQVGDVYTGGLEGNTEKIKDRNGPRSGLVETKKAKVAGEAEKGTCSLSPKSRKVQAGRDVSFNKLTSSGVVLSKLKSASGIVDVA